MGQSTIKNVKKALIDNKIVNVFTERKGGKKAKIEYKKFVTLNKIKEHVRQLFLVFSFWEMIQKML